MWSRRACLLLGGFLGLTFTSSQARALGEWCAPFRVGHVYDDKSVPGQWALEIARRTRSAVDSKAEFEIHPFGQLGDSSTLVADISRGNLSLSLVESTFLTEWVPGIEVLKFPGLVADKNAIAKLYEARQYWTALNDVARKGGLRIVAIGLSPKFLYSKTAIQSPDDFKSLSVLAPNDAQSSLLADAGAQLESLAFAEIPVAIQNGQINAFLTSSSQMLLSVINAEQGFVISSPMFSNVICVVASESFLRRASDNAVGQFAEQVRKSSLEFYDELASRSIDNLIGQATSIGANVDKLSLQEATNLFGGNLASRWESYAESRGIGALLAKARGDLGV